jgi:integrase
MGCQKATQGARLSATETKNQGRGGADVGLTIARFDPRRVPPEVWAEISPLARQATSMSGPRDKREATEVMSRTAALLAWCHGQGIDLNPNIVFLPDTLDRYIAQGCAAKASGTQSNYRRILRRVAAAVLGPAVYPPRPLPLQQSGPLPPYSRDEEAALVGWSRGLPTARMRDGVVVLLALGLGAGLEAREVERARADWIEQDAHGLTVVVTGDRSRRVPVVRRWDWAVRDAVDKSRGGLLFRSGQAQRKRVSVFTENLPRADAPKLSSQRLRATWIVRHLEARVSVNALAVAAGINGEELFRYAARMASVPPDEAERILRGESR